MLNRERPARGQGLFSRLGRLFGLGPVPRDAIDTLSALHAKVADLTRAEAEGHCVMVALREAVEGLEKQIGRAGKEQFRANALAEAQQQSFKAALGQLREAEAFRERELTHLRERQATATAEGRMEVVERLLPVLDGLGEALAAGRRLLEDSPAKCPGAQQGFRQRVMDAWALLRGASPERGWEVQRYGSLHNALTAWLEGLEFVQDRLLDVLAAEGVQPMETTGAAFDPHLHVAVEAAPSEDNVEPGRIVGETRRGYLAGDAVLRYAEVVVTR